MFLNHFALTTHPFAEKPPIEWLLRDEHIDQALARLKFFEQQGAIALIIGQIRLRRSKSSLLRLFIHDLPHNRYNPLDLHLTPLNANAFLRLIVTKLGEKPQMGKDRMLLQILERINQNDKCTIFIVDEAHLLAPQTLTDLRLLISSIDEKIPLKNSPMRPRKIKSNTQTFFPCRPGPAHNTAIYDATDVKGTNTCLYRLPHHQGRRQRKNLRARGQRPYP